MENEKWRKFRILTLALIFSGALNIALILALVISTLNRTEISLPEKKLSSAEKAMGNNCQILSEMLQRSFPELVVYLTNRDPLEEGYMKRDLALSALTSAHFFNLDKALAGSLPQKRRLVLKEGGEVELYPGLTEEQYEAIIRYAYQERWPLTSKGLFLTLKARFSQGVQDPSLCGAFLTAPEFHAIQVLFQKTEAEQDANVLLKLLCEGPWEMLERFVEEQSELLDLSVERRRSLLLNYLSHHSPTAAVLLLKTDFAFVKTRLADAGIISLLDLLKEPTALSKHFCTDLLHSPRSDAVWQAAAATLYRFVGEMPPFPFDHQMPIPTLF